MAVDNIARGMAAKALENQGGGGSSLPIVNTATVGQIIKVAAVDGDGKPTEWEAGNASWNDLEDKPFGKKTVDNLLPTKEVNLPSNGYRVDNGVRHYYLLMDNSTAIKLITGETYVVIWDDVEYECVAYDVVIDNNDEVALGNATIRGAVGGKDEPFLFSHNKFYLGELDISCKSSGTHKFGIEKGVVYNAPGVITLVVTPEGKFVVDWTAEEIKDALNKRITLFLNWGGNIYHMLGGGLTDDDGLSLAFDAWLLYGTEGYHKFLEITYTAENEELSVSIMDSPFFVLPSVTSDDNGKVLKVVDGVWTAVVEE